MSSWTIYINKKIERILYKHDRNKHLGKFMQRLIYKDARNLALKEIPKKQNVKNR